MYLYLSIYTYWHRTLQCITLSTQKVLHKILRNGCFEAGRLDQSEETAKMCWNNFVRIFNIITMSYPAHNIYTSHSSTDWLRCVLGPRTILSTTITSLTITEDFIKFDPGNVVFSKYPDVPQKSLGELSHPINKNPS